MPSTFKITGIFTLLWAALALLSLRHADTPVIRVREQLTRQTDSLLSAVRLLQDAKQEAQLQQRFRLVRLAYKRIEWAVEYFDPLTTRLVNGPPVPEAELNGLVVRPDGLQVIEAELFPHFQTAKRKKLSQLLERLAFNTVKFQAYFNNTELQDWQILDAAKLEVFRVEVLGLNDFDNPLSKNCFAESAAALQSVAGVVYHYQTHIDFGAAIRYLRRPVASDRFDRAVFIRAYADPLTRQLTALHQKLHLPDVRYNRLLNQHAATLFEPSSFNQNAFTGAPGDSASIAKIALGKKLFFDPILSGTMNRSCATCHQPEIAFTDGMVKNRDITGKKMITRNTPTLINAALQPAQFYDLRSASLEEQARDVMQNRDEMHGDMQVVTGKLWRNDEYRRLFSEAYPEHRKVLIDTFEVMNALASYVRSLTALNSRFDRYMQGQRNALNQNEIKGFNLFMGKAKCSTCHYLPLFNGALPPRYMQIDAEVIGVPKAGNLKVIDIDRGRFGIIPMEFNRYAFKVPSVRNAARTAPYMHNGVFKTLKEVMDFYNKGGGIGTGIKVPDQTLSADPLHLSNRETGQIISFIQALDSH